jgi:hypothetical protein
MKACHVHVQCYNYIYALYVHVVHIRVQLLVAMVQEALVNSGHNYGMLLIVHHYGTSFVSTVDYYLRMQR